jgi:hypothetical protein
MYSTPYVLLYNFRIRPLLVSQSSFLASDNCDNSNDGAGELTEASSQLWRQRYDSKLNYELY